MILTKDNLRQWKEKLRKEMQDRYGVADFDKSYSDADWINDYEGLDVEDAIDGEIECWEP